MKHSILIAHRNRHRWLDLCLWSIIRSAERSASLPWEIIVVDNGSDRPFACDHPQVRVIQDDRKFHGADGTEMFNKSAMLNRAIEQSTGDLLTFLDCDMIVGHQWMAGVKALLADPSLIRLCYRARKILSRVAIDELEPLDTRESRVDLLFAEYDGIDAPHQGSKYPLCWEAYREPGRNRYEPDHPVWGNSQFSVTREHLGDLRLDERQIGKGAEDFQFNQDFYDHYGDRYRGAIRTEPEYCLLHVCHSHLPADDWFTERQHAVNLALYLKESGR